MRLPKFEVGAIHKLPLPQISSAFHPLIQQHCNSIDPNKSIYPYLSLKRKIAKFSTNVTAFAMMIGVLLTNKP
jgi:hypothetical protein